MVHQFGHVQRTEVSKRVGAKQLHFPMKEKQCTLPLTPKGSKTQSVQNLNNNLRELRNGTR